MKAEVISQRVGKLREQMREHDIDALVLIKEERDKSLYFPYLFGFSGSLAFAVITHDKATLLLDSRYTEQCRQQAQGVDVVLREYEDKLFAEQLPELFGETRRVGIMRGQLVPADFHDRIRDHFSQIEFLHVPNIAGAGRAIKGEEEIDAIRRSVRATEAALRQSFLVIKPGVSELEVREAFIKALPLGAKPAWEPDPLIFTSGERTALVHGAATERVIRRGEVFQVDAGCILPGEEGGYVSDLSRVIVCGRASPAQKRVYRAIVHAIKGALKLYLPGLETFRAQEEAVNILKSYGYSDEEVMGHSLGHGIGLEAHEAPQVSPRIPSAGDTFFEAGQVVTVEPGIYSKRLGFGMRVELNVVIREYGPQILDELPWEDIFETD